MPNTPDDWPNYFLICPHCKQRYHVTEGYCPCEDDLLDYYFPLGEHWDGTDGTRGIEADNAAEAHFEDLETRRERGRG